MPQYKSKIQIKFRQKWYQVWLPKEVTLYYNLDPIKEVQDLANDLRAAVFEIDERLDGIPPVHRASQHKPAEILQAGDLIMPDEPDPIVEFFAEQEAAERAKAQPLEGTPLPKRIEVLDEAEIEADGGDFVPQQQSQVVEYDEENEAEWTPDQNSNVVIAQPDIIGALQNKARKDDMQHMRKKYRNS